MEELQELMAKMIALSGVMPEILKRSFENIKPEVEDANIAQLEQGIKADGTSMPNYSVTSIMKFGKRPGPMNLRDKGDFHRGITLNVGASGIELIGNDLKTDMLELRYGSTIIGLTAQSKKIIEESYLREQVQKQIAEYFNK